MKQFKRVFAVILIAAICLLTFAGCGEAEEPGAGSKDGEKEYTFTTAGVTLAMDDDATDLTKLLGEPNSYFEAESCAFAGLDKTYTYSGFVVTTSPDADQIDRITSVYFTDDSASTEEGLYIGESAAKVESVYGTPSEKSAAAITYKKGKTALQFLLSGEKVESIEYFRIDQ